MNGWKFMTVYPLDTLQLTQEKEKSSVAQCSTGWFKNNFLECVFPLLEQRYTPGYVKLKDARVII